MAFNEQQKYNQESNISNVSNVSNVSNEHDRLIKNRIFAQLTFNAMEECRNSSTSNFWVYKWHSTHDDIQKSNTKKCMDAKMNVIDYATFQLNVSNDGFINLLKTLSKF